MIVGAIVSFTNQYKFLSNFYPAKVKHGGIEYPSSEHAYQAEKTSNLHLRQMIAKCKTPTAAKRLGRTVKMDGGFERNKVVEMRSIVYKKFAQNPVLARKLLATGNRFLVEGNKWGDDFWGVTQDGYGRNMLGSILMDVRETLRVLGIPE